MSTLTSSAINKSGKTVAPKPVARRRPAASRAAPSSAVTGKDINQPAVSEPSDATLPSNVVAAPERQIATPPPTQLGDSAQSGLHEDAIAAPEPQGITIDETRQEPESVPSTINHAPSTATIPIADTPSVRQVSPPPTQVVDSHVAEAEHAAASPPPSTQVEDSHTAEVNHVQASPPSAQAVDIRASDTELRVPEPSAQAGTLGGAGPAVERQEDEQNINNQANALIDAAGIPEHQPGNLEQATRKKASPKAPRPQTAGVKRKRKQPTDQTAQQSDTTEAQSQPDVEPVNVASKSVEQLTRTEAEVPASAPAPAPKPQRKRQKKQQTTTKPTTIIEGEIAQDIVAGAQVSKPKTRAKPKRKAVSSAENEPEPSTDQAPALKTKPRAKAKRKTASTVDGGIQAPDQSETTIDGEATSSTSTKPQAKRGRRAKAVLSEPPETQEVSENAEVAEGDHTAAGAAKPKATRGRKRKSPTTADEQSIVSDPAEGVTNGQATTKKPAKMRVKRAQKTNPAATAEEQSIAPDQTEAAGGKEASVTTPAKPVAKRARKRKVTIDGQQNPEAQLQEGNDAPEHEPEAEEEDPEMHEIDVNVTTMSDLTRAKSVGKTSEREKKMAEIDWTEVVRKRREQVAAIQRGENETRATSEGAQDRERSESNVQDRPRGVQLRMVNGEMVINDESRTIDRQAEAIAGALGGPINEDEDLTARVNRTTWMEKKKRDPKERVPVYKMKSDPWNDDETDRFYDALRMFGTDFFIISKMFPPKTRRQIKLKFIREERLDRERINRALLGENVAMDLQHFADVTGQELDEFKDPRVLEQELEREGQEQRVEIEQKKKETAEAQKQRDIQMEAREKEKAARDQDKQAQKAQRRARKKGQMGTGTF